MQIRVLGAVELVGASGVIISTSGSKMSGLVALLALDAGKPVSAERIVDSVWGQQGVSGANVVHVTISKLRRILVDASEGDRIVTSPGGYALRIENEDVDALQFEALIGRAQRTHGDPTTAADLLGQALGLWRGPPLAGVPDTDSITAVRARLEEMRRDAVEDLVDVQLELGHHRRLVAEIEALVGSNPSVSDGGRN